MIVATLLVPAGLACLLSGGVLLRVMLSVPRECPMQSEMKKCPSEKSPNQAKLESMLMSERLHASSHSHGPNGSSSFMYHHPLCARESDSVSGCCKPLGTMSTKIDNDCVLSEAESLMHPASVHSHQSNCGVSNASHEVHPLQLLPPVNCEPAQLRGSMAFKTNTSAVTPTKLTSSERSRSKCHYKLRSATVFFLLMTPSWGFGALVLFYDQQCHWVFSYLYAVTVASMGFFLFLNYCMLRSDVKSSYYAFFCNRKLVATSGKTGHIHMTYQVKHYPANFCNSDRKSSMSSIESGHNKTGNAQYVRRNKSCRSNANANSFYMDKSLAEMQAASCQYPVGAMGHHFTSNPAMNQVLHGQSTAGRVVALHNINPRGNFSHVRSAQAINRGMGVNSRSGSSVRELDLVSLPEHIVAAAHNNNFQANHVGILNNPAAHMVPSTRSQNSINGEVFMAAQMQSDQDSQRSSQQQTPIGHNTPVSSAGVQIMNAGRFSPLASTTSRVKSSGDSSTSSRARQPLGSSHKSTLERSTPNLSHNRPRDHHSRPSNKTSPPSSSSQNVPVPVAAIMPTRQTPDILKVSSSTGLFSGLSTTSGSKIGMDSDDVDSYSSSDDGESSCSFPRKQQFRKLIASNSRSTVSSGKADSCM